MVTRKVKVFSGYERFWHWSQMALIFLLLFTGLGLNGAHHLIGFKPAVMLHILAALSLAVIWIFTAFWMLTSGAWRHFVPRFTGMLAVARYYAWGIFRGEEHPYHKRLWRKHNPLQAITYFALETLLFPLIWLTGLAYLTFGFWQDVPDATFWLTIIANLHLIAAYMVLAFVILHVYLLTAGHGIVHHVQPMLTGYDEVELTPEEEAYLAADEPWRLKE